MKSSSPEAKLKSRPEIAAIAARVRKAGKRVVFTNGCFDLLHVGHVRYLAKARALGDLLVVGVNRDSSVRRLKGPKRPIVPERERAEVLAALQSVDYVVLFSEDTPLSLVHAVRPAFLVKGGDWQKRDIVGWDFVESYGGRVKPLPFTPGRSTTGMLSKIKKG